jgi:hypothetical protein
MIEVRLTWAECEQAAIAGVKRQLLALHDDRPDYYGFKEPDAWGSHIEAAGAELAVAKNLGLFWTPWARRPGVVTADVGQNVQVRRRGFRGGHLLLHPNDSSEQTFVFVWGAIPTFELAGWIRGEAGKAQEWWGDPFSTGRPAFWIPHAELEPMDTLIIRPVEAA